MDPIIELAERLGKSIADSPQAQSFRAAQEEFNKNADAVQVYEDFQQQSEKLAGLEAENKPVEVADKHRLQELRDKLMADETFKKVSATQVEYVDLMRKVNAAMQKHLSPAETPPRQ